jgi:hypothetical protein
LSSNYFFVDTFILRNKLYSNIGGTMSEKRKITNDIKFCLVILFVFITTHVGGVLLIIEYEHRNENVAGSACFYEPLTKEKK